MPEKTNRKSNRIYPAELKREAVQMLEDGHSAKSIAERLGLPRTNLIYKWRDRFKQQSGQADDSRGDDPSVEELKARLSRVERERDILKKALAILGRNEP